MNDNHAKTYRTMEWLGVTGEWVGVTPECVAQSIFAVLQRMIGNQARTLKGYGVGGGHTWVGFPQASRKPRRCPNGRDISVQPSLPAERRDEVACHDEAASHDELTSNK